MATTCLQYFSPHCTARRVSIVGNRLIFNPVTPHTTHLLPNVQNEARNTNVREGDTISLGNRCGFYSIRDTIDYGIQYVFYNLW